MHAEAFVDLDSIAGNVAAIREHVAPSMVMAVVKAGGYGHGAVRAARAALRGGASWLGVAHVAEALELREAGIDEPLLCLMAIGADDHASAIKRNVDLAAATTDMVARIAAAAREASHPARVHLKADTGLSRGGATAADWPSLVEAALRAQDSGQLQVVGLWSHFAASDEPGSPSIAAQLTAFEEAVEHAEKAGVRPEVRHIANTAAAITVPEARYDVVRIGGGSYGLSTLPGGAPGWLRPAMTLRARLVQVKRVPAGTGVSYNHRYVTTAETTLGLVPLGYADGVPRAARGHSLIFARGRRWPIAGTVCMDQFVIDFGDVPVRAGEEVVLWGPGERGEATAQEWGEALGTISYDLVCGLGTRVPRTGDGAGTGGWPRGAGTAEVRIGTSEQMRDLGRQLAGLLRAGDIVILSGPLGAGKTTLTQGIGEGLGVRGPVTSPTFVIARVHPVLPAGTAPLVHVDAYRLGSALELDDLDLDADVDSAVTVVEWGEGLAEGLAQDRLEISIAREAVPEALSPAGESADESELSNQPRTVRITGVGSRWQDIRMTRTDEGDRL